MAAWVQPNPKLALALEHCQRILWVVWGGGWGVCSVHGSGAVWSSELHSHERQYPNFANRTLHCDEMIAVHCREKLHCSDYEQQQGDTIGDKGVQ